MLLRFRQIIGWVVFGSVIIMLSCLPALAATITYTYDNLNRLTKVVYGDGTTEEFTYDAAGNRLTHVIKEPDTTPPTGNVTVNNGDPYTPSSSVTLTLSASDPGSGVSQMRFSNDGTTWSDWEPYATSKTWTLPPGSGSKTVYVKFQDNAENISTAYTDIIVLDTDAPTGSIVINGGATYTTNILVNLTLSATDSGSGVSKMRFSNNFSGPWSVAEPYMPNKSNWDLSSYGGNANAGYKTVYAQYMDGAGNWSNSFSSSIYYNPVQSFPFSDDFSTDKGWIGYEVGGWERKPAVAGGGENGNPDPATDHAASGDNYILGFAIGGDYPNDLLVEKAIASPPINCTGQNQVFLKFWRYLNVQSNYSDHAKIYVSNDGTNWTQLWENPVFDLVDNQWIQVVLDISSIAANQATVYIKFTMGPTDSSKRFSGWNIDDVEVTSDYSGRLALYVPSGNSPNPNIGEIMIENGLGIKYDSKIPSDLSDYDVLIVRDTEACNATTANYIKTFVQNGGGAIIMGAAPSYLASPTQGIGTGDLSSIKDWFGAGTYGNDCSYATVSVSNPFDTDLSVNDKVDYVATSACSGNSVYNLDSDADFASKWLNFGRVHSFKHIFGSGRVFYYAGNPGYSETADPVLIDNSLTLFEVGLVWALRANPLTNTAEFVRQQYRDFLNREADAGGLAYWVNQIDTGAMTRAQVIESFYWSEEFAGRIAPIVRLYSAYFVRIPDYGGLMYWVNVSNSGTSLWAISDSFAGSEEFQQRYGTLSNEAFVELIYHNILGRSPDSGGYAFWVGELNSRRETRGQVMVGFSESDEYKSTSSHEVFVTMMYVGMLRRSPEQGGFDYWVNYLDSGGSGLALIDGFLNSQEYANRF